MKKQMLMILDGWGLGKDYEGNAIMKADTPNFDRLMKEYPHTRLKASGEAVGLPEGQMGNSEVGHMNIGAGRVVYQDLTRINREIESGKFYENPVLLEAVDKAKKSDGALHLLGLVSKGGVHSHMNHLFALLKMCKKEGLEKVYVHAFLDGRDVSPTSGTGDLKELMEYMDEIGIGEIATVSGRYYAMDRDKRWERTQKAYDAILSGKGIFNDDPVDAVQKSYEDGTTDEFVVPVVITKNNEPVATLNNGDSVIFFNFRPDRARQLTRAIVDEAFDGFDRAKKVSVPYVTMTEYDDTIQNVVVAYPPEEYKNTIGEIMEKENLRQLRIAETEKYAHVTFFLNGGVEEPYKGEDRILVNSPKVATYDLQPEMSAPEVKERVIQQIKEDKYDLIVLNFANTDMVGHTGVLSAAVKAAETVDSAIGEILKAIDDNGNYDLYITADHGNSEYLIDEKTGEPFTAHTTNEVPFIVYPDKDLTLKPGKLSDIMPTILKRMGIEKPMEMTGESLIEE